MSEKQREKVTAQSQSKGPLSGIRVIDMSGIVMGSFATQMLGDLGADVIKIERPQQGDQPAGDIMRWAGETPAQAAPGMGPLFLGFNANKRSLSIDLNSAEGRHVFQRLLLTADVFVSNIRMSSLQKLSLDYAALQRQKADLIYAHASGYGGNGAYAGLPAYDDLIQALSGTASLLSRVDGHSEPRYFPALIADKTVGLYLSNAILAALFQRERTGQGQFVEVPMLECFTHFVMCENLSGHSYIPPVGDFGYRRVLNPHRKPYPTRDSYIAIVPYNDDQWYRLFEIVGQTHIFHERFGSYQERTQNIEALYELVESITPRYSTAEWLELLRARDIPAMPVHTMDAVMTDEHLRSVGFFQRMEHPAVGSYVRIRHPVHYSARPELPQEHAPVLGDHTEEILAELGLRSADKKGGGK